MKSPFTGKEMTLKSETRSLTFRKESFDVIYRFYLCEDTGQGLTTTELDEVNLNQLYNQYRDKYNLPFPDEIRELRKKYNLSATKMSEVLGFGVNTWSKYEQGEIPSKANGNLIQMIRDPKAFGKLVELNTELKEKAKEKILKSIESLVRDRQRKSHELRLQEYLLGNFLPDQYTGYRKPSLEKLTEMVVFFAEKLEPFTTKLNKLLYYSDFLNYSRVGYAISGIRYQAIQRGPVPLGYKSLFENMIRNGHIEIYEEKLSNDVYGDHFIPGEGRSFDKNLFTDMELSVLQEVYEKFETVSTREIIDISHDEIGWKENEGSRSWISYQHGLDLVHF